MTDALVLFHFISERDNMSKLNNRDTDNAPNWKKEEMAAYAAFTDDVTEAVERMVGDSAKVIRHRVLKNNSMELDGISICETMGKAAPTFYFDLLYYEYLKGMPVEKIASKVVSTYNENKDRFDEQWVDSFTFEGMKDSIIFRLVSAKFNSRLLEDVPHIRYLDLAVTFHCLVQTEDGLFGSVLIHNSHLEDWKVSLKDIRDAAVRNTPVLLPIVKREMGDMLESLIAAQMGGPSPEEEEIIENIHRLQQEDNSLGRKMLVLTTENGNRGAGCILYEGVLENLAREYGGSFYILPSSVHEIIIVPNDGDKGPEELEEMVRQVNLCNVPEEDILSDRVYLYPQDKFDIF